MTTKYLKHHNYTVGIEHRVQLHQHRSCVIWFTGLSGSGKSTIANAVEYALHQQGISTYTLDGDNIRLGINKDLGFNAVDRSENLRRIAEIARLFIDAGVVVLAAFVSPYQKDRDQVKAIVGEAHYLEVYVSTNLEVCEQRDVKGLYERARTGKITNMTGISQPYEVPHNSDVTIDTAMVSIAEAVKKITAVIQPRLIIKHA